MMDMYRVILTLSFLWTGYIEAQIPGPRVVSSGRGWYLERSSRLLLRGNTIDYRERMKSGQDSGDLILDCNRRGWLMYHCASHSCNNVHACAERNEGGARVTRLPLLENLMNMFGPLRMREPVEPAVAAVRDPSGPTDAVVLQTPEGVHWAPALSHVLDGRYCFRLAHLPILEASPRIFTFDWDRSIDKEGIADIPNLGAGLYEFQVGRPGVGRAGVDGACRIEPDSAPAWLLITPQSRFDRIKKEWDVDASKINDLERSGVSAINTLRHAALAWLAESIEK